MKKNYPEIIKSIFFLTGNTFRRQDSISITHFQTIVDRMLMVILIYRCQQLSELFFLFFAFCFIYFPSTILLA
jgi:hypothetical protein